jgi:hypothetical protein
MSESNTPKEVTANDAIGLPEKIYSLATSIGKNMFTSLKNIGGINSQSRLLSLNARIEAARAGEAGRSFSIVATEMVELSARTRDVAEELSTKMKADIDELTHISKRLASDVRGTRFADLALNNLDLIDRNLYERSCDVRWWATDSSVVEAAADPTPEHVAYASKRLGVILNAYTVYFDLVVCSLDGVVLANGRPEQYQSTGMRVDHFDWFRRAKATHSGDEFGFETVHTSPLVNGEFILAYSASIRENGEANGRIVGVLGILFKWMSLAQTIVDNTPLSAEEKRHSRVCILETDGTVLADTRGRPLGEKLDLAQQRDIWNNHKGFHEASAGMGRKMLVAHAIAPGFETYTTGWHSVILHD